MLDRLDPQVHPADLETKDPLENLEARVAPVVSDHQDPLAIRVNGEPLDLPDSKEHRAWLEKQASKEKPEMTVPLEPLVHQDHQDNVALECQDHLDLLEKGNLGRTVIKDQLDCRADPECREDRDHQVTLDSRRKAQKAHLVLLAQPV